MIESLYRTHRPWLVQWCTAMTGDPVAAEDLVQDTFLRALEHLEDLEDLSQEQLRSWLRRTAKNRFIDLIRRARRAPEPQEEVLHQDDLTRPLVAALCAQLPPEEDVYKRQGLDWGYSQRTVTRLVEDGFLTRAKSGRAYHLNLSQKGQQAFEISHQVFYDWDRQVLSALDAEEQRQLFTLLEKIRQKEADTKCTKP